MDLSTVSKHSSQGVAFSAAFFSCMGGIEIGRGLNQLQAARFQYDWIGSFLVGAAFLGFGIFWAVILVRRARSAEVVRPT